MIDAAVVGVADERLGAVPVAVVQLETGATVDPAELIAAAAEHLAPYEVPAEIRIADALPRTASHKVDLTVVRALLTPS